jgi:hypothetical protein
LRVFFSRVVLTKTADTFSREAIIIFERVDDVC